MTRVAATQDFVRGGIRCWLGTQGLASPSKVSKIWSVRGAKSGGGP